MFQAKQKEKLLNTLQGIYKKPIKLDGDIQLVTIAALLEF